MTLCRLLLYLKLFKCQGEYKNMFNTLLETYKQIIFDNLLEEIKDTNNYEETDYCPENGNVVGLTYYKETEPIGKELIEEFFEAILNYDYDCKDIHNHSFGNILNFVAWFMWELLITNYKTELIEWVNENYLE